MAVQDPPDRSLSATGLATAWPPADLVAAIREGAERTIERLVAGDVLGARHKLAEVRALLTRQPMGKRGKRRLVTHAGKTQSVSEWARELGRTPQGLMYRLHVMPLEEALTPRTPPRG